MKNKPSKEKLKTIGLIILALLIIGYVGQVSFKKYQEKQDVKVRTETLDSLIVMAKTCQAINITGTGETIQIADLECLKQAQQAQGNQVIPVIEPIVKPVIESEILSVEVN